MKIYENTWILFTVPALLDITINKFPSDFSVTLLVIAFSASIIGSLAYATNKNLEARLRFKNYIAIFTTGLFLSYIMFEVARYYHSITIAGVGSAIVSYFSIYVIIVIGIVIKALPKIILGAIKTYLKDESNNNSNSN